MEYHAIRRLYRHTTILTVMIFFLLLLGNTVRNMKAGLSCPDWPLCYGQLIPHFNTLVYYEFSHRVLAGLVSLYFLFIFVNVFRKVSSWKIRSTAIGAMVILLSQIVLGGLTVLKLLDSYIVAMHLITGISYFSLVFFLRLQLGRLFRNVSKREEKPGFFSQLSLVCLIAIFTQSFLGGLVASNYAGLSCKGFPACNGEWFPELIGAVGIQMIHRFGAFTMLGLSVFYFVYFLMNVKHRWFPRDLVKPSIIVFVLTLIQFGLGIANVYLEIPVTLSVLHLAAAALLAITFVKISYEAQQ